MTTADFAATPHRSARGRGASVNLAGTDWPLYKLEALVAGLLTFVALLVITQAMQPAVLVAAAATVVVWWARRLYGAGDRVTRAGR
ncbi:hypothetical protein [Rhodococcus sp. UNC363MFTsu5.1]|uniref:hypothetical protein n=1 Tax=Rhodococcus sp. UNC363MFTsu5.1 TaxID=1449069 RepID=UPI00068EFD5D|nr:hypothetical protein [Rhodococcus sp. UNC363MFTsu5.1]